MALPEVKSLLLTLEKGILYLTLNRPESRNAMTSEMLAEIGAVFDAVQCDRAVRIIVLRGAGGHFCSGGDLKSMMGGIKAPAPGAADPVAQMNRAFGDILRKVNAAPQAVIAVCEGAVLGGGFGLACVSDIAFAHADAKFGMPETTRGIPPAQIAPFVVERIGLMQARKLVLTGAQFRGAEASRLGIVHDTFANDDELQVKLGEAIRQVLNCGPLANAVTKDIVLRVGKQDMDSLLDYAAQRFADSVRGPEAPEGITAFMQKRPPKWAQEQ